MLWHTITALNISSFGSFVVEESREIWLNPFLVFAEFIHVHQHPSLFSIYYESCPYITCRVVWSVYELSVY